MNSIVPWLAVRSHCLAWRQDLAEFKVRLLRFLACCERELQPYCPARAPELLMAALELVANAARLHLLAARLPAPLILQLHTLAHCLASVRSHCLAGGASAACVMQGGSRWLPRMVRTTEYFPT